MHFVSNRAVSVAGSASGGAVSFSGTSFTDNGSIFDGNQARSGRRNGSAYGGALSLTATSQLIGSLVTNNYAYAANGFGGGVALPLGPEVLTQVQANIRGNCATTAGDDLWWPQV